MNVYPLNYPTNVLTAVKSFPPVIPFDVQTEDEVLIFQLHLSIDLLSVLVQHLTICLLLQLMLFSIIIHIKLPYSTHGQSIKYQWISW